MVGSGECCKRFSDSESIGSYLAAGSTFSSPLMSLTPLGFDFDVVTSAFISNNAFGYSSVRLKPFSSWLRTSSFGWVPSHSGQQRLDRSYLLGPKIRIRNALPWLICCCDYALARRRNLQNRDPKPCSRWLNMILRGRHYVNRFPLLTGLNIRWKLNPRLC